MKQTKHTLFLLLTGFFVLLFQTGYSQIESVDKSQKIAEVSYRLKKDVAVYSFTPLTDFDEFKTNQRVNRFKNLTGENVTVQFKKSKVQIELNPNVTKGDNLDKLINLIVRIHGFEGFVIK
jgi:hypothetical protein